MSLPSRALLLGCAALAASFSLSDAFAQGDAGPSLVAPPPAANVPGLGNPRGLMNPDISLNGLFSLAQFNRDQPIVLDDGHDPRRNGFNLQLVELSMTSNVDPYFRADANILFLPSGVEIEEAYGTTLDLPWNLQLKAGQFFTAFGRQNPTHPHSWDWANKPLVMGRFFGGDGLRNLGAQLSWLTPLPWFSEITGSIQDSTGDLAVSFDPEGRMRTLGDGIALLRWSHFVPVTDEFLVNFGGSYLNGKNREETRSRTQILGADLLLRYRALDSLSFLALQVEVAQRRYGQGDGEALRDWGGYAELKYRLPLPLARWHVGVRYDLVGDRAAPVVTSSGSEGHSHEEGGEGEGEEAAASDAADLDRFRRYRISPVVTYYPSEFSKVRLQYDYDRLAGHDLTQHAVFVQFEFIIGAHGAHKF